MEKVTAIGGVFIKSKDVKSLTACYQKHLGIEFGYTSYVSFEWLNNDPEGIKIKLWQPIDDKH